DVTYAPFGFQRREKTIAEQLEEGMGYLRKRHRTSKFIAYFQSFTSTYGPMEKLLPKFQESLNHPDVVGFALSTRPDCLDEKWVKALAEFKEKLVWIEIGLQSANNKTLERINRCHTREQFEEAIRLWKRHTDIPVCAHAVLGLPGETKEDILETARCFASLPLDAIKIHNLHVVKGTPLAKDFQEGRYQPISFEEYVDWTIAFLEETPPHFVIHRINAHAPRSLTLAPEWSVNKLGIFNAIEKEMERRNSWQGKTLTAPR
ncbi:MAG: TIGR01212 family radical SAM protein, partial [Deltaproteobacteria bacterium]|nr:TIGR01212 family radical SAM protein [Deltaproteobacteria bacterium]